MVGIVHLAKGLEFKAVAVMACDDDVLPLQERIETASDQVLVTGVDSPSEFLGDMMRLT